MNFFGLKMQATRDLVVSLDENPVVGTIILLHSNRNNTQCVIKLERNNVPQQWSYSIRTLMNGSMYGETQDYATLSEILLLINVFHLEPSA